MIQSSINKANELGKIISEEKLIVEILQQFNVSSRTAKEYLKELEIRNTIVRFKGEVWNKFHWEKMGNILTERTITDENGNSFPNPSPLHDEEHDQMIKEKKERIKDGE